jgi:valyl-tRNA synthetase
MPHTVDDAALLIVADWPAPEVAAWQDAAAESEVEQLIELVRGIRNARSEARIEPAAWLPVDLVAEPASGPMIEALRPAIERLARARPLTVRASRAELDPALSAGGLAVIGQGFEAVVSRPVPSEAGVPAESDGGSDRQRLERELAGAGEQLAAVRERLANEAFTSRAPATVVEGARNRERELAEQVERLTDRLGS